MAGATRAEDVNYLRQNHIVEVLDRFLRDLLHRKPINAISYLREWAVREELSALPPDMSPSNESPTKYFSPGSNYKVEGHAQMLIAIVDGIFAKPYEAVPWLKSYLTNLNEEACMTVAVPTNLVAGRLPTLPIITALVVDCGTGETKLLLYRYGPPPGASIPVISMKELTTLGPASDYLTEPEKFVALVGVYFKKHKVSTVLVAASSWLRSATGKRLEDANAMLKKLMSAGITCKVLEQEYEGWLEATAVEYASKELGLGVTSSWASGGGSAQICSKFRELAAFHLGNREGKELIQSNGSMLGMELWRKRITEELSGFREKNKTFELKGLICAMSGVSFAALSAKLKLRQHYSVPTVKQAFQSCIDRLIKCPQLVDKDALSLSNVVLQQCLLEELVHPDSTLYFARDLEVHGQNFRVTWSCGWFINLLSQMGGIQFKDSKSLRYLQGTCDSGDDAGDPEAPNADPTQYTMCDINTIISIMEDKAKESEILVTPELKAIEEESGGAAKLEGLNHKLKTHDSLSRKLRSRLEKLLLMHKYEPFFLPRIEDVVKGVDDVLRYTIKCDREKYAETVQSCYERLVNVPGFQEMRLENYWQERSTYFGITSWVTRNNFTFELQFHTDYSWMVKQSTSHELYGLFRLLQPSAAKLALYNTMKSIWQVEQIPPGLDELRPIFNSTKPFTDELMEQYQRLKDYEVHFLRWHEMQDPRRPIGSPPSPTFNLPFTGSIGGHVEFDGLCGRLMRGKSAKEFEYLAFPHDKRVAWFGGSHMLEAFFHYTVDVLPALIADNMGKFPNWVEQKLRSGDQWRLIAVPQQYCKPANWDGLLEIVIVQYPEVASILTRFGSALKVTPFETIQNMYHETFRVVKDAGLAHPQHMTTERLQSMQQPTLWHVRGFLYNILGANELFRGDGLTYNEAGIARGPEFVCANKKVNETQCAVLFPIFHHASEIDGSPQSI